MQLILFLEHKCSRLVLKGLDHAIVLAWGNRGRKLLGKLTPAIVWFGMRVAAQESGMRPLMEDMLMPIERTNRKAINKSHLTMAADMKWCGLKKNNTQTINLENLHLDGLYMLWSWATNAGYVFEGV